MSLFLFLLYGIIETNGIVIWRIENGERIIDF